MKVPTFTHAGYPVTKFRKILKSHNHIHIKVQTDIMVNAEDMIYEGCIEIPGEGRIEMEWDRTGIPPNMARIDCYLKF